MTTVSNELLYEVLKSVQDRIGRLDGKVDIMAADLRTVKGRFAAFMGNEVLQDTRLAEFEARLARIERRLELTD